jgi:hypothetical protein
MCAVNHADLKRDDVWPTLVLVGFQRTPADDYGPETVLELRNCACGSTLAKDVTPK